MDGSGVRVWVALGVSVLVAVGSVPAASAVAVGPDPAVVPAVVPVVEGVGGFDPVRSTVVEELTGPSTLVYANPDGSRTAVAASGPVRYRDGAGWRDLDPTLVGGPGGLVGRAVPAGGPVLPLFADGPLALRAADGTALEVRRVGVPRVPGVPVGSMVGYEDGVGGGRGLRLRLLNGGEVEEEVVVPVRPADAGAAASWQVEVGVPDGWSAREAGGAVELVDASGGLGLRVAGGPARDGLEPEPAEAAVSAVLVGSAGGWATVRFGVDPGWLAAPERVFPVVLDPSYTTTFSAGDTSDTYISSSNPNTSYWLDAGLKVGTPNGIIKQRSFLNWDLSTVKAGGPKVVVGASLRLWETAAFSCNPAALTVGPSSALAVEATTWNSGPATAIDPKTSKSFAHRGASGSCPAAQEVIDVKEMAKAWVYDLAPQLGTALIAQEDPLPPPADARSG